MAMNEKSDLVIHRQDGRIRDRDSYGADPKRNLSGVLYAYLTPDGRTIINIGKAYGETVARRFDCKSKDAFWTWAARNRIDRVIVLVGEIRTNAARFTEQMLEDVESLLLYRIKPSGNVRNTLSRSIGRPGMRLRCLGQEWPAAHDFYDPGPQPSSPLSGLPLPPRPRF
jgi:hypothetical protein